MPLNYSGQLLFIYAYLIKDPLGLLIIQEFNIQMIKHLIYSVSID